VRVDRHAIGAAGQDAILDLLIGMEFADQEPADHAQCPNLTGGSVRAVGHPGDWTFTPAWSGARVSDAHRP